MKKPIAVLAVPAFIISALLLTACAPRNASLETDAPAAGTEVAAVPTDVGPSETSAVSVTAMAPAPYELKETAYESGGISIKYPQLVKLTDTDLQDKLNKMIADSALRDMDTIKNDGDVTDYEITYQVTYNTPKIISMYFSGYSNYRQSAHPNQFLYAVTIDVDKMEQLTLPSLVQINEAFIQLLKDGKYLAEGYEMTPEYEASIRDYLNSMDTEYWLNELRNADTPGNFTSSYLTEDGLVVSVSVPHVMGDHIEILLSYKALDGYHTDNPLWSAIRH